MVYVFYYNLDVDSRIENGSDLYLENQVHEFSLNIMSRLF